MVRPHQISRHLDFVVVHQMAHLHQISRHPVVAAAVVRPMVRPHQISRHLDFVVDLQTLRFVPSFVRLAAVLVVLPFVLACRLTAATFAMQVLRLPLHPNQLRHLQ